ncbi:hypothetical protein MHU86_19589 [Fragilaria crotonensis]|nr:hypothetical protein MHU86_19589 [Fragilaria crotonensis]
MLIFLPFVVIYLIGEHGLIGVRADFHAQLRRKSARAKHHDLNCAKECAKACLIPNTRIGVVPWKAEKCAKNFVKTRQVCQHSASGQRTSTRHGHMHKSGKSTGHMHNSGKRTREKTPEMATRCLELLKCNGGTRCSDGSCSSNGKCCQGVENECPDGSACCHDKDCGDINIFKCLDNQCVGGNYSECDVDADCINPTKFRCENHQCILRNCDPQVVECCRDSDCDSTKRCISYFCVKKGNPSFSLQWFGDDDLDLHVVTPGGAEISYSNKADSLSGGELDHDDRPIIDAPANPIQNWVENVNFPLDGTSPVGTYTFFVLNYDQVNTADPWELKSYHGETVKSVHQGTLNHQGTSEKYTYVHVAV